MKDKTTILVIFAVIVVAIIALVVFFGGVSGSAVTQMKPRCPMNFKDVYLRPQGNLPNHCYYGTYPDGSISTRFMCCNQYLWKVQTRKDTFAEKYTKTKSQTGKYY